MTFGEAKVIKPYLHKPRGVWISRGKGGGIEFYRKTYTKTTCTLHLSHPCNEIWQAEKALLKYWGEERQEVKDEDRV